MARTATRRKLTPPELAAEYGVSTDKVHTWIRNGELRAIDAATVRGGRPRYLIDPNDVAAFEAARSVAPPLPTVRRPRRQAGDCVEFIK